MSRRRKTLPASPVTCHIVSLSHEGRGIARAEGKTMFVDGGLPGEKVVANYVNRKRNYDELQVEPSTLIGNSHPDRVVPPCQYHQVCGGCSLQHVSTSFQISHKQSVLLEQLSHFGNVQPEIVVPPLTSMSLGYRTKARLGVRYIQKYDEVLVGFRESYSNFLTRIDHCAVLIPAVGERISILKELIKSLSACRHIPQIEVAAGQSRCALIFRHMVPLTEDDHGKLVAFSESTGLEIYLQPKGPDTVHKLWPADGNELLNYVNHDAELKMDFHPTDFTQVNPEINQKLLLQAIDWLDVQKSDQVLDLFCGLGNFTLPVARKAAFVTGVEGSSNMVSRGTHNARINNIKNVEFVAADLHLPWQEQQKAPWKKSFNKLILDPPRSGAEEMVKAIQYFNATRIVYVSCNPATLARDAGILHEKGYRLRKAGVLDMFPHTSHVESMALFTR